MLFPFTYPIQIGCGGCKPKKTETTCSGILARTELTCEVFGE